MLAGYLDVATDEVVLTTERFGKAALAENPALPRLEFNVSHSGDQGLLAVTPRLRVGVDVEKHGRAVNLAAVAESTFTHYETHTWRSVPEEGTVQGFFDTWVLKEAFVKATGLGIGYGLRNFEVSIVGEPVLRSIHGNEEVAKGWTLVLLDSDAGYSSGLAVEGSDIGHLTFEIE
ncbi:MAG: 4'-phosphopantetheinyl transferase superfamily protein [Actinomycetota bacterium]